LYSISSKVCFGNILNIDNAGFNLVAALAILPAPYARATDAKLKADASLAAKARKAVGLAYGAGKIAKAATKLNPALSMLSMLPKQTFDDILYNKKPQA
jgi:hypothetical protein